MSAALAREALEMLIKTAAKIGASEIHMTLPMQEGVDGSTTLRVGGILIDLDPRVEEMLLRAGNSVVDMLYTLAIPRQSKKLTRTSMSGRFFSDSSMEDITFPEGMTSLDVLLVPGIDGLTNVFLRLNPPRIAATEVEHVSWTETIKSLIRASSRPARGVTLFVGPETEISALLMMQAANSFYQADRKIMVFDSLPWVPNTSVSVAHVSSEAEREAMIGAANMGTDIFILGNPANFKDFPNLIKDLCSSGVHVWVRCKGSVSENGDLIAERIGLPHKPAAIVRCARVMSVDDRAGEPISDEYAIHWLTENHSITGLSGCKQRKANAEFPSGVCMASYSVMPENQENTMMLARLGAQMVDRGVLCGLDASRKLS